MRGGLLALEDVHSWRAQHTTRAEQNIWVSSGCEKGVLPLCLCFTACHMQTRTQNEQQRHNDRINRNHDNRRARLEKKRGQKYRDAHNGCLQGCMFFRVFMASDTTTQPHTKSDFLWCSLFHNGCGVTRGTDSKKQKFLQDYCRLRQCVASDKLLPNNTQAHLTK